MTGVPKPADMTGTYTCVYDAWNRLVKVSDGQTTMAEYRYDGLGRRIRKYVPDGENWTVPEYYYSAGWQVLEVRRDGGIARSGSPLSEPTLATTLREQYVWSPRYIDSPILRDRDNAAGGDLGKSASGRRWATLTATARATCCSAEPFT
jgi:YD repeat-containing protein